MESVTYGIYLVTFVACLRVLLFSNGRLKSIRTLNYPMVVAALLMFVFGSLDVAFGLRHNIDAFVSIGDPDKVFADISNWINVMKMVDYVAQTFIGDAILLYRCYVVWHRRWFIIILPVLTWLGCAACGIMTAYIEASLGFSTLNQAKFVPFITSMLSLTLATNVITTSLIVYRIWNVQSKLSSHRSKTHTDDPASRVMRVLVESGLLYTASILVLFGTYLSSNNAILGVSDTIVQIIGITFNLIIVQTNQANNSPQGHGSLPMPVTSSGNIPINMSIHTEVVVSRPSEDPSGKTNSHDEKSTW